MKYNLRFLPGVAEDAIIAYNWYEEKSKGLGEDFLRIFYAISSEIKRNPLASQKVHKDFRRKLMRRFPYAIYYLINKNDIIVYGLFHSARNPVKIKSLLVGR